jgi:small nuclear ribonucleoprotein (snRNP)-like protein
MKSLREDLRRPIGRQSIVLALLFSCMFSGCKRGATESAEKGEAKEAAAPIPGVRFKAGKGLLLPEETQKSIGVEIVEVGEEKFAGQVSTPVEVYRASGDSALALARMKPATAQQLRVGQSVRVQTDSGESLTGKVVRLDPQMEKFLGQTEVLIEISGGGGRVTVGARFKAIYELGEAKAVAAVPRSAVLTAAEGPFVYVVNGQHFLRTLIKTGGQNKDWVEVTDGLYAGDKIVSRPVQTLWLTELRAVKGGGDID